MEIKFYATTDVGRQREHNEDNYLVDPKLRLFVVADGMGGHAAGEVASQIAVHELCRSVRGHADTVSRYATRDDRESAAARSQILSILEQAIQHACNAIFQAAQEDANKRGMGTTTTALILLPQRYLLGQVGDSRGYLLRDGQFLQVTKDHSYVQEQVDLGLLTPEQARVHPYSNVITRCIGANSEVVPDLYFGHLRPGDVLLLASDGLTGMLEDEYLALILKGDGGPQQWVDRLINEANRRGGLDNITAIIVRIEPDSAAAS